MVLKKPFFKMIYVPLALPLLLLAVMAIPLSASELLHACDSVGPVDCVLPEPMDVVLVLAGVEDALRESTLDFLQEQACLFTTTTTRLALLSGGEEPLTLVRPGAYGVSSW